MGWGPFKLTAWRYILSQKDMLNGPPPSERRVVQLHLLNLGKHFQCFLISIVILPRLHENFLVDCLLKLFSSTIIERIHPENALKTTFWLLI